MKLFTSATVKLTTWFLCAVMVISLLFSTIIFQVARSEINTRLQGLEHDISSQPDFHAPDLLTQVRTEQLDEASKNLLLSLLYINLLILFGGGVLSYIMARRILEPIKESHEAQARFVSNASHQLRTPLTVMKTEIESILDDPKSTKQELREELDSTLEEVDHLTELSGILLRLTELNSTLSGDELHDVIDLEKELPAIARSLGANSRLELPDQLPKITTNRVIFTEVVSILLDNALKYSTPKTPIIIQSSTSRTQHNLTVTSTGKTITKDHGVHIFERFYRGEHTTEGHGLGLPLARQLMTLLDGSVTYSSSDKQGTSFTITLPKKP